MLLDNQLINKSYKACKRNLIIGIIIAVLGLGLLGYACIDTANRKKQTIHLNDVILSTDKDKEDKIAYLDMVGFMQFATYGDDLSYYIAYDNDLFYIISMKDKDYEYFADQFDTTEVVRAYGFTKEIAQEAKSYAIQTLNEELGEEAVSYANFEDIFGDVYLAVERDNKMKGFFTPLFALNGVSVFFGAVALAAGLILFFANKAAVGSFEKYQGESPENYSIARQISSEETKTYDKLGLILTDQLLISCSGVLNIIDYKDIFWTYLTNHRTNGISDYNFLNICTNDGKRFTCGSGTTFGKKNRTNTQENHNEILDIIAQKNPDARIGYTKEYLDEFNQLLKSQKNK